MPDAGFKATERQFIELVAAVTGNAIVRLKLLSISDVPRADRVRHEIAQRYRDVSELWDMRLDGLIVTGTEPRAANSKGRAVLACAGQGCRLGIGEYRVDNLVMSRGARSRSPHRRHPTSSVAR